jgi:hypothetical protein
MFVNDTVDFSDFFVAILDGVGSTELAIVLRDGFKPCEPAQAPLAATDLGWRNHKYSLSAFKGQHIRLVFSNRNLHPNSWGIWTVLDDVRVVDAGPLPPTPGSELMFLPVVAPKHCDPLTNPGVIHGIDLFRLARP